MAEQRIVVVGGGVIGCALAYTLAGAGQRVTLLERGTVAGEASGVAAGLLAPIAESSHPGAFLELAVAGLRAFQEEAATIEAVSGCTIEHSPCGIIRTAQSRRWAAGLQSRMDWASGAGLPVRWLERADLLKLEPAIGEIVIGGLDSPEEAQVHPRRLTEALAQGAARRGAVLREGVEASALLRRRDTVCGVLLRSGEQVSADAVVLAGGAWTAFCAPEAAGLPVYPVHGQFALLRAMPQPLRRALYGEDVYLVPRVDGTIYVGATEEPQLGFRKRASAGGMRQLLQAASMLLPAIDEATFMYASAGLRPGSVDGLPLLGQLDGIHGLYLAAGHFRNGVLLSLISARLLTELLVYGHSSLDLQPFSPSRAGLGAAVTGQLANAGGQTAR